MQNSQSDWRSSPNLNVISVIISVIGLIISSFSDISTPVKVAVIVVGLAACLYVIFSGKPILTPSTSIVQNPADITYAPPPAPSFDGEDDQLWPAMNYAQSPPIQSMRSNPAVPPLVTGKEASGWFSFLKGVLLILLVCVIMFGLPGFFLFRSNVAWQHIVGTILLMIFGFVVMSMVMPNSGGDPHKISYKLRDVLSMIIGSSFLFGFLLFQSSITWQQIVGLILLLICLGMPVYTVREGFFENSGDDPHKISHKIRDVFLTVIGSLFVFGLSGFFLFRSSVNWQHMVGLILLMFCLGMPAIKVNEEFFEKSSSDKTSNKS